MLRARPWFVRHPHQGLVETPHVATRVALVANHHFRRPMTCATHLAMERRPSEVALGVHLSVQDEQRAVSNVLNLLLPSCRIAPLHKHHSTWFDLDNPRHMRPRWRLQRVHFDLSNHNIIARGKGCLGSILSPASH